MMALLRLPTERQESVRLATTANWLALFKCLLTGQMAKSELLAQAKGADNDYLLQINTSSDEQVPFPANHFFKILINTRTR